MSDMTKTLDPAQRLTARRYAQDLVDAATSDPVERQALILAAGMLVTAEGRRLSIARQYLNAMTAPTDPYKHPKITREGATR